MASIRYGLWGRADLRGIPDEEAWFNQNRAAIIAQYSGQWILVKDKSVRGAFPTYDAAFNAGIQQFGLNSGFIVKQAVASDPKIVI
jgi:hypothetical protein